MTKSKLNRVTVLGAGVLGGQIAWHSAFKGKAVVVYDPFPEAIAKVRVAHEMYARIYSAELGASDADLEATRSRVAYSDQLEPSVAKADLVIEAVPEVPEIKTRVYQQMAALLPPHTIIATNSSTLLPRDFAEATGRPEKYCALHFANLIWALNLVEIMAHPGTSRETLTAATLFAIEIGQVPIAVQKEQNGYVLNTWFVATLTAAMSLVVNGVSTPEDVDRTYMIANRGCAMGPCGLLDMVGMKTAYDVSSYWGTLNDDAQMLKNAAYVKERFLDKGLQGLMGGEGFYKYPNPAYAAPDFLAVPDSTVVPSLVDRMLLRSD
ncbi:MAG: 3-hydroxyacyl-CoA dehydrogenase [Pseudomonadota bacterium]|nr:3-hydroxyacyl-CoA dehydrogenase [Pseudomonadota bacterium]